MSYKEVFKNDHFIVVDKDPMVLSVPGRDKADDREVLGLILEADYGRRIFPVHRLDYEVSGLILYAFTPEAHRAANRWFENKEVHKTYHALAAKTKSEPDEISNQKGVPLVWKSKLLRGKKRAYEASLGKPSETHAMLVAEKNGIELWELNPVTGRSHQLRYELYRHHRPILNDELYGCESSKSKNWTLPGIALRAFRLDFRKAPKALDFHLPLMIEVNGLSV